MEEIAKRRTREDQTMNAQVPKDAVSIGERLSYCQCATCLPCLARVEIERQSAELVRHENDRVILTQIIEALTAQRDQYKQRLIEAQQFAVRQGNELRKLRQ
jgi:hypothetical protein